MDLPLLLGAAVALVVVGVLVVWRGRVFATVQGTALFLQQVRGEVRRVTWPSWDDVRKSTVVIIILLFIVGIIIGMMDWVFSKLLIDFLGRAIG